MSISVTITNNSDSFALGTVKAERQSPCPHCGHTPDLMQSEDHNILPRDSSVRIIKCGDKLVLEALSNNGIPPATY